WRMVSQTMPGGVRTFRRTDGKAEAQRQAGTRASSRPRRRSRGRLDAEVVDREDGQIVVLRQPFTGALQAVHDTQDRDDLGAQALDLGYGLRHRAALSEDVIDDR